MKAFRISHRVGALLLLALSAACTSKQMEGQSPAYAVLDQLSAASGVRPALFAGYLASDVLTYVKKSTGDQSSASVCDPTVFQDAGRAFFHLQLKDPGSIENPIFPSPANTITFTRYHLKYKRGDGRNVQGVDVPYEFDGGMQLGLVGGNVSIGQLVIVRSQAKQEAPLRALIGGGGANTISTIAEITFYGTDTAGREVTVTGFINVDFADWGDPDC